MASYNHIRTHSRTPSNLTQVNAVHRSRSPSVNSEVLPISRTPSPHVRNNSTNNSNKPLPILPPNPVPTPPPGMKETPEIIVQRTTELHERLPRGQPAQLLGMPDSSPAPSMHSPPQPKVPNAYYLKRKMSKPDAPQAAHLALSKHKPAALNLPSSESDHGFPEDPNRPISQRPFSQHYPWPYDPSSYYNMARSPTVSIHPKPKAYPVGWEENGGLSRPVSMGGIDLPIPLSPIPVVPTIPEQYRKGVAIDTRPKTPEHRVVYDHERDGLGGQISEKTMLKQQQKSQQTEHQQKPATAPAQDSNEYIPEASTIESLAELWEFAAHGKLLSHRVQPKRSIPSSNLSIPEGVYVLNMYRGAPLNAQQPDLGGFTPEHFAFGPTPSNPFYTIQALPDALHPNNPTIFNPNDPATFFNDLLILRRNPVTHKDTSVLTMGLNPHAAKSHRRRLDIAANGASKQQSPTQGDELITLIYPKQAAMMAIDSSSIHVDDKTGRIVGGDAQTMAREAVERAAETECCRLSWDVTRDRYYLYHPGIGHGGEVYLVIIDDGNYTRSKSAEPSPGVGFDMPGTRGSIKLINVDTSEAIVVLDFKSGLLFVNTMATRKIPSLYIVDVAVSTVLAVAVVEGRRIRDQQHFLLSSMQSNGGFSNGHSLQIGGTPRDVKRPGGGFTGDKREAKWWRRRQGWRWICGGGEK
ncbi:hypothetical protein EV426DRAFT_131053 [Tirmania nivea]|nr:hypothetical protein EV426DRAFT_131053 [Tirmania nivea]